MIVKYLIVKYKITIITKTGERMKEQQKEVATM